MVKANHIFTVDLHVMGEPIRLIIGGTPYLKGESIGEKKKYFEKNFDNLRSAVMLEPRGHNNMFGAILCEPVNELADIGIFFMHSEGYLNMCGHGTIGAVTAMIEMGLIDKKIEDTTEIVLETAAGLVYAYAKVEDDTVKSVTVRNVPSFVLKSNIKINVPNLGDVNVDIAYGGNFFGLIDVKELNLKIEKEYLSELTSYGVELRKLINENIDIHHPDDETFNKVELIVIYDSVEDEKHWNKNCVVFGKNQVDRSPCGSGTSAMLAYLYHNNQIMKNESFTNESIIGTQFFAKAVDEVKIGNFEGVIPEITGRGFVTGNHHFIIKGDDPLNKGFSLA